MSKINNSEELNLEEGVVGIDLGTTNSVIAYMDSKTKKPSLIKNKDDEVLTKSFIWVKEDNETGSISYKVGSKAKEKVLEDPDNVVSSYKPHMGTKKVIKHIGGKPFTATHCSMLALKYMKESAMEALDRAVPKVVISVPAYFEENQKTATLIAAKLAGIDVLGLVAEPTAASFYYATQNNLSLQDKIVLVFDIGGGTFDASIVKLDGEKSMVLGLDGNQYLGGDDFDQAMAHWVEEKLGVKIPDPGTREVLIQLCEKAKRDLSVEFNENGDLNPTVTIDLEKFNSRLLEKGIEQGKKSINISMEEFESIISGFVDRTRECVERVLEKSGIEQEDIDEVVLVGGSSRVPLIRKMLSDFLENDKFDMDYFNKYLVDPDLAVGYGAAIYAKLIMEGKQGNITDICPKNLGIENDRDELSVIIKGGSSLPATGKKMFTTTKDNQEIISVNIYEGINKKISGNTLLGKIDIPVPKHTQAGEFSIIVRFSLSKDGILGVKVIGDKVYKLEINRQDVLDSIEQEEGSDKTNLNWDK